MNPEQIRRDEKAARYDAATTYPRPRIRVALTADGDIEAAFLHHGHALHHVVIDPRHGEVVSTTVPVGTDDFRRLAKAARRYL